MFVELLIGLGSGLSLTGTVLAATFYLFQRKRRVVSASDTSATDEKSGDGIPYRGLLVPLHYDFTLLTVSFTEKSGRDLKVDIRDFLPEYGGQHSVLTYRQLVAKNGTLQVGLSKGTYDVHFVSTDKDQRRFDYEIVGIEVAKPLEKFSPIGLTMVTIGIVLVTTGLAPLLLG